MITNSLATPLPVSAEPRRHTHSPTHSPDRSVDSEEGSSGIDTHREADSAKNPNRAEEVQEAKEIRELATRDREVRAHEAAHLAAGGPYTSQATFTYQRGPSSVLYAVGGEVKVDLSPIPGNPEATLRKAEIIRRAAHAPAQPSAQDRAIAQQATQMAREARAELLQEAISSDNVATEEASGGNHPSGQDIQSTEETGDSTPRVDLYA